MTLSVTPTGVSAATAFAAALNPTASLGAAQFGASLQGELARLNALDPSRHGASGSGQGGGLGSALPVS